jgi:hypothetical protein
VKLVAVTKVPDGGAAQVLKEALADRGITVELKPLGSNPYLGGVGMNEIEVRVPEDQVRAAETVLEQIEQEAEAAALRESGADEHQPEKAAAAADEEPDAPTVAWRIAWVLVGLAVAAYFILQMGGR